MPERILSWARKPSTPKGPSKGRILLRVDPASFGRFSRIDLDKQGYQVTSVRSLSPEVIADQAPDTILFFHHTDESLPLDALEKLPRDVPVIVATVGNAAPDRRLIELAQRRGYPLLKSRMGPNLHVLLEALTRIRISLN